MDERRKAETEQMIRALEITAELMLVMPKIMQGVTNQMLKSAELLRLWQAQDGGEEKVDDE